MSVLRSVRAVAHAATSKPLTPETRVRFVSNAEQESSASASKPKEYDALRSEETVKATPERKKTQAEIDEDLRQKLESISGGGGEAGLELENGQPVAMKRGVKNNMFRLI